MADDSLEMTVGDNSLELEVNPPYVGSAFSPEVDIDETTSTITVTITDARGEHSYSIPNPESAIDDAEAATTAANAAASAANSAASAANTAKTAANSAATAATDAASTAGTATTAANNAATTANGAAANAISAAETASAKATLANTAATAANSAASAAGNAASAAISAADYADTATRDASAAADAANSAAGAANAAAAAAESATTTVDAAVASANSAAAYANEKGGAASNAANAANSAASSATSAASAANSAASAASTAATNADSKASAANTAAGTANTAATAATSAAAAANTAAEAATEAAEYAANFTEAYLPLVTSGAAESLLSTDEQTATFTQRVSDHDGSVGVRAILGNTVVWNQIASGRGGAVLGILVSRDATDISSGAVSGTATATDALWIENLELKQNHKYYGKFMRSDGGEYYFTSANTDAKQNGESFIITRTGSDTMTTFLFKITEGVQYDFTYRGIWIDLTTMFGAGNEPSTVAEFEALYPDDYYPYDVGSLLSVNIEGIESAGITREIPASTYFPTGIKSAGTAHDELQRDKAITRIGAMDLGDIVWNMTGTSQSGVYRAVADIAGLKPTGSNSVIGNVKCTKYISTSANDSWLLKKGISVDNTLSRIYVYDPDYNGADSSAAFEASMSGVYLFYELATPTTTEIDPPINMDYLTENGGVESIVVPTGEMSAPMPLVYVQGYDANGVADKALSVIAAIEGAKASTNYAIGSYFVHDGKLYKATSAIASGETITPGTNCTATTVMAEIMALS